MLSIWTSGGKPREERDLVKLMTGSGTGTKEYKLILNKFSSILEDISYQLEQEGDGAAYQSEY